MPTFNQIRSELNKSLNKKRKRPYQKNSANDIQSLAVHFCIQMNQHALKGEIAGLKDKHIRRCLSQFVDGHDCDHVVDSLKQEVVNAKERQQKRLIHRKNTSSVMHEEHYLTICNLPGEKFYKTPEWQSLRYQVIRDSDQRCLCCGASPKEGAVLHVDHIKPRSLNPELALIKDNLQVLCGDCNLGKSNKFSDDWR